MFTVDRSLPTSLPAQIAAGMRDLVASGRLAAGDRVPSTRELAERLHVSRGSVVAAYDQLTAEGLLLASQGAPTVVHPELPRLAAPLPRPAPPARRRERRAISLAPTSGHAGTIRPAAWRRAWREAAAAAAQPVDKAGQAYLRAAVAEHLRLARGLSTQPGNVLVTGGAREGLLLILMSLGKALRVGVEDPGHPGLRRIIPLAGHTPVTCVTDGQGVVVDKLPSDLDAVLVTPSHLYPLGAFMPAPRRIELLEWAARAGVVVIEDDFNSELRYRLSPQPPLAALAREATVVTLGTFSTLLSRQLNAGYVVANTTTADTLRRTREVMGMPVSTVTQHAIAHLLNAGDVRRTTKKVHARLVERREILNSTVFPALRAAGARLKYSEDSLGVDAIVDFADGAEAAAFDARLARGGLTCGRTGAGLILSFGHLSDEDFAHAVSVLAP